MFVFIDLNRQWCRRIFWMFYVCVMAKRGKIYGKAPDQKERKNAKRKTKLCCVCVCVWKGESCASRFPVPGSVGFLGKYLLHTGFNVFVYNVYCAIMPYSVRTT